MTFEKAEMTLSQWKVELEITIVNSNGNVVTLEIIEVSWAENDYTLYVYTNNPLNIDKNKLKMPFARRLQEKS